MRDCVKARSGTAGYVSIVGRLRTCKHPPGSMLPAALCALAAASCAPAYTKPSIVLPPNMHTTGTVRPPRVAPPIKEAVSLPNVSNRNVPGRNVPSPNVPSRNVTSPTQALLKPQPEPDCTFPETDTAADERQKLDYERQCYRHAEMIARARLQLLQESVAKTATAVKSGI
jgi:hypothetical protein